MEKQISSNLAAYFLSSLMSFKSFNHNSLTFISYQHFQDSSSMQSDEKY